MSQFERIEKIRCELIEAQDQQNRNRNRNRNSGPDYSETSSRTGDKKIGRTTKKDQQGFKNLVDKEEIKDKSYKDYLKRKAKELNTTPAKLEKSVDRGIRAVDRPAGGRMPSKGYASGEPFQPDNNPQDPKGKYPATGKSTLKGRMRYGLDKKASAGDRLSAVKKRLDTRIRYAIKGTREEPRFKTKDDISKFVDKVTKNQGPLSKATGKKSTLYKTLKAYTDAKNPTIKGKSGGKLPMPEGPKRDAAIKRNLKNLDKKIVKAAKLPKGVKLPVGGTRTSAPIDPKEFNLQYKADKLKLDYGGRFAQRDGLTDAQRKRKLEILKKNLSIKNPTITSPVTGRQLPATKGNLKKYGFIPSPKVKPLKDTSKGKKLSALKTQPKYLQKISKFSMKHPRLRGVAAAITAGAGIYGASKLIGSGTKPKKSITPVGAGEQNQQKLVPVTARINLSKGDRATFYGKDDKGNSVPIDQLYPVKKSNK